MGTSGDHKGKDGKSPLVPPHADAEPEKPLPDPPPNRFSRFRRSMTDYIKTGSSTLRDRTLSRYAREASGGSSIAFRKFGAVATSGADLISGFSNIDESGSLLNSSIGQPIDIAAQIISEAVAPQDESRDIITSAMQDAIMSALEGKEELESTHLTEDILADILIEYLTQSILIDIWHDYGDSERSFDSPSELRARNDELRTTIRAVVDSELSDKVEIGLSNLNKEELRQVQLDAIKSVTAIWENYE